MGGPLTDEEIQEVQADRKYENFVETGPYMGHTTFAAAKYFKNVYTIEIMFDLFLKNVNKAREDGVKNVSFLLGDSVKMLDVVVPIVLDGAVFFIDAHISGSDSGWNQKQRVPLIEELKVILSKKIGSSVFIFDDLRLWAQKVWDWAHITNDTILALFKEYNYNVTKSYEKNDRFYVFTK